MEVVKSGGYFLECNKVESRFLVMVGGQPIENSFAKIAADLQHGAIYYTEMRTSAVKPTDFDLIIKVADSMDEFKQIHYGYFDLFSGYTLRSDWFCSGDHSINLNFIKQLDNDYALCWMKLHTCKYPIQQPVVVMIADIVTCCRTIGISHNELWQYDVMAKVVRSATNNSALRIKAIYGSTINNKINVVE